MEKIVLALKLVYFREANWLFSTLQRGNFYPPFRKFLSPHKKYAFEPCNASYQKQAILFILKVTVEVICWES